jgi:large subunit ribosomal protein L1
MGPIGGIGNQWRMMYGDPDDPMKIKPFKELTMDPSQAREFPPFKSEKFPDGEPVKGIVRPDWLTLEKWESWPSRLKLRHPSWWLMVCDKETGELIYDHKWEYTVEKAISETVRMYEVYPYKENPIFDAKFYMNLDPRFPDQQLRCSVELPHGLGSEVKVAVFCGEDDEEQVLSMGAYKAGRTLLEAIEAEDIDFDVLIAKPQMMPQLAKLGKILGPRRLMPSPKSGTVITDYEAAIKQFSKGGTIELRSRSDRNLFCNFGRMSMTQDQLKENFNALVKGIVENAPPGAENPLFDKVRIHCFGLPAFRIELSEFPTIREEDD